MADEPNVDANEEGADLADECQITSQNGRGNYCTSEDCKWAAWRLYAEGNFAFRALSRAVNKQQHPDHPNCPDGPHGVQWAQRAVDYCGKATREAIDRGGDVALGILLQGYQADLQAQLTFATSATASVKTTSVKYAEGKRISSDESIIAVPDNTLRSLARQRVTDIREKQAQALGVVTKRQAQEITGPDGGALQVQHGIDPSSFDNNPAAREAAFALAGALLCPSGTTADPGSSQPPDDGTGDDGESAASTAPQTD